MFQGVVLSGPVTLPVDSPVTVYCRRVINKPSMPVDLN
jgi:hypothetical protein